MTIAVKRLALASGQAQTRDALDAIAGVAVWWRELLAA
jgi:hypothetical protein